MGSNPWSSLPNRWICRTSKTLSLAPRLPVADEECQCITCVIILKFNSFACFPDNYTNVAVHAVHNQLKWINQMVSYMSSFNIENVTVLFKICFFFYKAYVSLLPKFYYLTHLCIFTMNRIEIGKNKMVKKTQRTFCVLSV